MTDSISRIVGNKAPTPSFKPLTEALTEDDLVNMIMGVQDGDLRKGLKALKKGQLKKIYAAITGRSEDAAEAADPGAEPDDSDEPANQIKKLAGKPKEPKEPKEEKPEDGKK